MNMSIYEQTRSAVSELFEKAKLKKGDIIVVGCSTSEVVGAKIGTNSNPDVAGEIFKALHEFAKSRDVFLAVQCCEHLNRAIITERKAVPFCEYVNVKPQPKAVRLQRKRMRALMSLWQLKKLKPTQGLTLDLQ